MQLTYRGISYQNSTAQEPLQTVKAQRLQFLGQVYQHTASPSVDQRQQRQKQQFLQFRGCFYSLSTACL